MNFSNPSEPAITVGVIASDAVSVMFVKDYFAVVGEIAADQPTEVICDVAKSGSAPCEITLRFVATHSDLEKCDWKVVSQELSQSARLMRRRFSNGKEILRIDFGLTPAQVSTGRYFLVADSVPGNRSYTCNAGNNLCAMIRRYGSSGSVHDRLLTYKVRRGAGSVRRGAHLAATGGDRPRTFADFPRIDPPTERESQPELAGVAS